MESPFTPEQIVKLDQPIDKAKVAHRQGGGGAQLSYIEGHEAIDAANRLFGYGTWGFEVIGTPTRDHYTDTNGEIKAMWYTAKVRLHVRGCEPIEEMGLVEVQLPRPGRENTFGQQVDVAMKGSITDALKRALRCYGDQFGNSLYDRALQDGQPKQDAPAQATSRPVTPSLGKMVNPMPHTSNAPQNAPKPVTTPQPIPAAASSYEDDANFKLYSEKIRNARTEKELSELGPEMRRQVVDMNVLKALGKEYTKRENTLLDIANARLDKFAGSLK